jgi:hypothetical protein
MAISRAVMRELLEFYYLALPFAANALLLILGCSAFLYFSYRRLRVKGYRPPAAAAIILTAGLVGITLTVLRKATPTNSVPRMWFDYLWIPLLLSAVAMGILLLILPRRRTRVFGRRQVDFPLLGSGRALIGSGLALIAGAIILWMEGVAGVSLVLAALVLTLVVTPTGLYLMGRGRRAKSVLPAEEVLGKDSRPLVLYLRAFLQESRFFVIGPKSECGSNARSWHAAVANPEQNIGVTFEEYLAEALSNRVGPFVALGSPEDYLPPEGALRTYADDARWKEVFHRFARQSACIVAEVGKSANLRWEFMQMRQDGMQEKLFVFTPCSTAGYASQWGFWNLLWSLKGLHRVRWREFSNDLGKLGFEIGFDDPGPGSVITFDSECRGMILTAQAYRPAEFVEPIAAWVRVQEKIGRHVRVSCSVCGKPDYLFSTQAERAGKHWCRVCEMTSHPGARVRRRLAPFVGCVYWAYLLVSGFALMAVGRMFRFEVGPWDRLLGCIVIGILLLTIAIHIWLKVAWDGSPKDDRRAASWYRYAADKGSSNAMVNLGLMYRRGWGGLPKDDVQAASWYLKAAEAGSAAGMNNVGFLYENGIGGLPKSAAQAITWYRKAADLGQTQAEASLKRLRDVATSLAGN